MMDWEGWDCNAVELRARPLSQQHWVGTVPALFYNSKNKTGKKEKNNE